MVDKSLLTGSTTMLLLKLLEERDMYGYEMIETLRQRSDHTFDKMCIRDRKKSRGDGNCRGVYRMANGDRRNQRRRTGI